MRLDERGKACPLPVIEAKKALEKAAPGSVLEIIVDNEIAVQNLKKLAAHKGLNSSSEKINEQEFLVSITAGKSMENKTFSGAENPNAGHEKKEGDSQKEHDSKEVSCAADCRKKGMVVVLASEEMGQGDAVLGKLLMKGFVYALIQQDKLPETVLLFNGGAKLSCEGSDSLEDLKELEAQGVEILTCGTCLNHYGISDKLSVGHVTNMYEIAEKMTGAEKIVRP